MSAKQHFSRSLQRWQEGRYKKKRCNWSCTQSGRVSPFLLLWKWVCLESLCYWAHVSPETCVLAKKAAILFRRNKFLDLSTNTTDGMNKISLQRWYRKRREYTRIFLVPLRSSFIVYLGETQHTLNSSLWIASGFLLSHHNTGVTDSILSYRA